jgi:hypothetical protein
MAVFARLEHEKNNRRLTAKINFFKKKAPSLA